MKKAPLLALLIGMSAPCLARADSSHNSDRRVNQAVAQDVSARLRRTVAALKAAEGRRSVSHRRAAVLKNTINRMRTDYTWNKRKQGFVSAGELASYNRGLDEVDREIRR